MEQKTIEKVLNQISEERLQDNQELRSLKAAQEKQNQDLEKDREEINLLSRNMETLKTENQTLLQRAAGPIKQIEELGSQIEQHSELLKKPVMHKTVHVHQISGLLMASIALFCIAIGLSIGWYQTCQRLSQYRNNDTKWRRLLLGASPLLTKIMLDVSDNVEQDPDKERKSVKAEEDHNLEVWNLQQKMKADSAKMHSLEPSLPNIGNSSSRGNKKK